jgi:hypothetical protein
MWWGVKAKRRALYSPPPRKVTGTHCIEGWVGPQTRSRRVQKISPPLGFDPRTVQPVESRYTERSIPAPDIYVCKDRKSS